MAVLGRIAQYEFLKNQSKQLGDYDTKNVADKNQGGEKDSAKENEDMIGDMVKKQIPS